MDLLVSTLSLKFFSNPFSPRRGEGKDEGCFPHPDPLPQGERELGKRGERELKKERELEKRGENSKKDR